MWYESIMHAIITWGTDTSDIFNIGPVQSIAYFFSENRLKLWFGTYVDDPQYETISIPFLEYQ